MRGLQRGQSLIELVVGIGIGVLFITAAIGIITVSLRLDFQNKFSQTATELAQEAVEQVSTYTNNSWDNLDLLARDTPLHLKQSAGFLTWDSGSSSVTIDNVNYDTSFEIENVCRDSQDAFVDCPSGTPDPSTLKITAATQWSQAGSFPEIRLSHYVARIRDRLWLQNDWSSGSSSLPFNYFDSSTMNQGWFKNATNTQWTVANQLTIFDTTKNLQTTGANGIDPTYRWAWNDVAGWFDFRITNTVLVGSTITGYANSNSGYIALDCATSPNGNICGSSNFAVAKSTSGTSAGILSGYAWNDAIGWISFNCDHSGDPVAGSNQCATLGINPTGSADYYVRLDSNGIFWGWAWNDIVGWISFNCDHSNDTPATQPPDNANTCGNSSYELRIGPSQVAWAELESIPFNTERVNGAGYNTIMWNGTLPSDTNVKFQIADADTTQTGPWNFYGPDGTVNSYYQPPGPGVQMRINRNVINNKKYVVYRIILESDPGQALSPTVNAVIINWSH